MKLFLVSASTGGGHLAASRAIETAALGKGHEVVSIDAMDYVPKVFRAWFRGGYEALVHKSPNLWGHLYTTADRKRFNYYAQTALDFGFSGQVLRMAKSSGADWIVCTHSVSQPRLPRAGLKMAAVITDLHPHLMWLRGKPNLYCVATEWSRERLWQRVPKAKIAVTGIPIAPEFTAGAEPATPTILLSAGGISGGPVHAAALQLAPLEAQLHVLTGWNKALLASLSSDPQLSKVTLHGMLDSPQVASLMRNASLIVGKSGGLTSSEALAVGLPFVVCDPFLIPGQEEQNARFLVEAGAGIRVDTVGRLQQAVGELLADRPRRMCMREASLANGKPGASAQVVQALEANL